MLLHIDDVFLKKIIQKHAHMVQTHIERIAKQFIANVFEFFRALDAAASELVIDLKYQVFYEIVTIVFVNVPIEKFHFPHTIAGFIKHPAQGWFVFGILF